MLCAMSSAPTGRTPPCDMTSNDKPVQGSTHRMMTPPATPLYKPHRFPAEIISHCVWLYFRFSLRDRDVQEMMAKRGVIGSHEAVHYWCSWSSPTSTPVSKADDRRIQPFQAAWERGRNIPCTHQGRSLFPVWSRCRPACWHPPCCIGRVWPAAMPIDIYKGHRPDRHRFHLYFPPDSLRPLTWPGALHR
jgi:hypothetical protein